MYLKNKNKHERDSHIVFDEEPHIYTIDGDSDYTSVTTWIHTHFEKFNADIVITKMMNGDKWEQNKYYGMTRENIKDLWDKNRISSSTSGTKLHYDIECYYNNILVNNNSIEYTYFKNFTNDYLHLYPYRTEWMIWDKELKLAGSIDMVYKNNDETFSIYDWKRCKEIKKFSLTDKFSKTSCIEHIPDSNYWHYSLQLNTYKFIIEKNYNKKIKEMYLLCLHPNNKNNNYKLIKVPDLTNEIKDLLNLRKLNFK
tara:strand:- start:554 stop:1315 length:762 start_codon:yes stop_codon:yes gene_type:complete